MKGKSAKQFIDNFWSGYGMGQKFGKDRALSEIEDAKTESLAPVESIDVTQPDVPPDVAPPALDNPGAESGEVKAAEPVAAKPVITRTQVAPQQYKLLGKTYDTAPTDHDITAAKMRAKASALTKYGDSDAGTRLDALATQTDRDNREYQHKQDVIKAKKDAFSSPVTDGKDAAGNPTATITLGGQKKLFTGLDAAVQAQTFLRDNPGMEYARVKTLYDKLGALGEDVSPYYERMEKMKTEGAWLALSAIDAGNPQRGLELYNSFGVDRVPDGAQLKQTGVGINPFTGKEAPQYALIDKDGKTLTSNLHQAIFNKLVSPSDQWKDSTARQTAAEKDAADEQKFRERALFTESLRANRGGGSGGGSGGRGGAGGGSAANADWRPSVALDPQKRYDKHYENLVADNAKAAETGNKTLTPEQMHQEAWKRADDESKYVASQQEALHQKSAISQRLRSALDAGDFASYGRDFDALTNMGSSGFTVDELAKLGFLPADAYRKDSNKDPRRLDR